MGHRRGLRANAWIRFRRLEERHSPHHYLRSLSLTVPCPQTETKIRCEDLASRVPRGVITRRMVIEERVTEMDQQNRYLVGWMIVVEADEETTGSTLSLPSTFLLYISAFSVVSTAPDEKRTGINDVIANSTTSPLLFWVRRKVRLHEHNYFCDRVDGC